MTLRIPIDTGAYRGELRVVFDHGTWLVRGAAELGKFKLLTPFYTVKEFDDEALATDYATTLAAAIMDVPTSEVTGV